MRRTEEEDCWWIADGVVLKIETGMTKGLGMETPVVDCIAASWLSAILPPSVATFGKPAVTVL